MENKSLFTELTQGKHLAIQLRTHILHPSSSSSSSSSSSTSPEEACFFLTEMIQSSFEKALLLLNWNNNSSNSIMADPTHTNNIAVVDKEEYSTKNVKRKSSSSSSRDVLKKRKLLPRWTEEIKVCSGTAPEASLNDGYSWRKYGQKDIHGANFPRCYYRCTHRNVRGCLATKQVQRSDNDQNIVEVTYRGRHTCNQSSNLGLVSVSNQNEIPEQTNQNQTNPNSEIWFNFGEHQHFNVKSEDFDYVFPSIVGSEIADENVFYEPMMEPAFVADSGLSAVTVSPPASETAWDWSGYGGGDGGEFQWVQSSEQSDTTEIISATTSVTNSPLCNGDWDFSLDKVDFDQHFPFDCLDF